MQLYLIEYSKDDGRNEYKYVVDNLLNEYVHFITDIYANTPIKLPKLFVPIGEIRDHLKVQFNDVYEGWRNIGNIGRSKTNNE